MERLSGLADLCLHLEAESTPMNVSALTIYDRSAAPRGVVGFADIQRFIAARAHRAGFLRRRLAALPLSLARPYWVDDPGFDIEFHVRHIALPKPGDWRQLCTQVARLHARPLDRNRPLWECYVIEELDNIPGLPPGSFALFTKAHYAALRGELAPRLFAALHELTPDARASLPKHRRYFDHAPSSLDLVARTTFDVARTPLSAARIAAGNVVPLLAGAQALVRGRWSRGHGGEAVVDLPAPRTRFNQPVSPYRVVAGISLPLNEVERVAQSVRGATVDDVATTVIAGALYRYLDGRLETPDESLVAEVPLGRSADARPAGGATGLNGRPAEAGIMPIFSDVEDPRERLQRVVAAARSLRGDAGARAGRRLVVDLLQLVPTPVLGVASELAQSLRLGSRLAPIANTTIASVKGPDLPLYFAGAPLVACYGYGVVHDLAGLGHVVTQIHGVLTLAVTACRAMLPDPARYEACLREAFDQLAHS